MESTTLKFFFDYRALKEQFKNENQVNINKEDWLDDLKLIFATVNLEKYRKDNASYIFSKQEAKNMMDCV